MRNIYDPNHELSKNSIEINRLFNVYDKQFKLFNKEFDRIYKYKSKYMFRFIWRFLFSRLIYDTKANQSFKLDDIIKYKRIKYMKLLDSIILNKFTFSGDNIDTIKSNFTDLLLNILLYPPGEFFNIYKFMYLLENLSYTFNIESNISIKFFADISLRKYIEECSLNLINNEIDKLFERSIKYL